jgi:hypothetical protein
MMPRLRPFPSPRPQVTPGGRRQVAAGVWPLPPIERIQTAPEVRERYTLPARRSTAGRLVELALWAATIAGIIRACWHL